MSSVSSHNESLKVLHQHFPFFTNLAANHTFFSTFIDIWQLFYWATNYLLNTEYSRIRNSESNIHTSLPLRPWNCKRTLKIFVYWSRFIEHKVSNATLFISMVSACLFGSLSCTRIMLNYIFITSFPVVQNTSAITRENEYFCLYNNNTACFCFF